MGCGALAWESGDRGDGSVCMCVCVCLCVGEGDLMSNLCRICFFNSIFQVVFMFMVEKLAGNCAICFYAEKN